MRIIRRDKKRTAYAWQDNGLWFVSLYEETDGMRRPMTYFNTKEELLDYADKKGVALSWLP